MDRDEFMELVYETFADEPDNVLANGIIEAADAYVEHEKAQLSQEGTTSDMISRQAARHALCKAVHKGEDVPCENQTASCLWTGTRVCDFVREIDALPTIQPEPTDEQVVEYCKRRCLHVVTDDFFESTKPQRLGRWIKYDNRFPWKNDYKCSECGNYLDFSGVNGWRGEANFCPNCGAKMKGAQNG